MTKHRLAVGSFTIAGGGEPNAHGIGVSLLDFDSETGTMSGAAILAGPHNPAFVAYQRGRLFSVSELDQPDAAVTSYPVDMHDVSLVTAIRGDVPCHIAFHPDADIAAICCYQSGTVRVHRVDALGLGQEVARLVHDGAGPHPTRQSQPHPHWAAFSPDGAWLLVADRGTDHIWIYRTEADATQFRLHDKHLVGAGKGPRTIAFSPDGQHLVVVLELASEVQSLAWNNGSLTPIHRASTLLSAFDGINDPAGLCFHPHRPWFAITNRGADDISLFALSDDGRITGLSRADTGSFPRDLDFSPNGRWLLTADQRSDTITVFDIDQVTGHISLSGRVDGILTPTCLRFA